MSALPASSDAPAAPDHATRRSWVVAIGVLVLSVAILVLRSPSSVFHAEFRVEDGVVFYLGAFDGPVSLIRPYHGSLHVAQRLIALAAASPPAYWAPVVMNGATVFITAGVAAFIASDRLRTAVPDRRLRIAMSLALVAMPAATQLTWNVTFLQWTLLFFLVARVVADPPRRFAALDALAVGIAALSGPMAIVVAPIYVWRRLGLVTWIVCGAALIQLAVLLAAGGRPSSVGPAEGVQAVALAVVGSVLPSRWTWPLTQAGVPDMVGVLALVGVTVLLVVASSAMPRRLLAVLLLAAGAVTLGAIVSSTSSLIADSGGSRYVLLARWVVMVIVLTALFSGGRRERLAAIPLAALVLVAVIVDFRIAAQPNYEWAERSACIGGAEPCVVPVYPGGIWDIHWPGEEATPIPSPRAP